jgi:general secretion pathway protein E
MSGEKKISLEQVAVFDSKAYETGIDDKVIVVSPGISPKAKKFAQQQGIKVIDSDKKDSFKDVLSKEEPKAPQTKSSKQQLSHSVQPEALQLIPEVMARRYNAIPVSVSGNTLEVAMADPTDIFALEAFSTLCRMRIKPIVADAKEIREAIDFNYKGYGEIEKQISQQ